jgi:PilZ domain
MDGTTTELEPRRRRRSLRRSVELETEVKSDLWDGAITLLATDLSLHGIWLEADLPLGIGSELTISFTPPDCPQGIPFRAQGTVVRVSLLRRRTDHGHAGMGVAFHDLAPDQVQRLTRALHGMPPPVPRRKDPFDRIARVASVAFEDGRAYTMVSEAPLMTAGRVEALGAAPPSSAMSAILRTRRALEYYY